MCVCIENIYNKQQSYRNSALIRVTIVMHDTNLTDWLTDSLATPATSLISRFIVGQIRLFTTWVGALPQAGNHSRRQQS